MTLKPGEGGGKPGAVDYLSEKKKKKGSTIMAADSARKEGCGKG